MPWNSESVQLLSSWMRAWQRSRVRRKSSTRCAFCGGQGAAGAGAHDRRLGMLASGQPAALANQTCAAPCQPSTNPHRCSAAQPRAHPALLLLLRRQLALRRVARLAQREAGVDPAGHELGRRQRGHEPELAHHRPASPAGGGRPGFWQGRCERCAGGRGKQQRRPVRFHPAPQACCLPSPKGGGEDSALRLSRVEGHQQRGEPVQQELVPQHVRLVHLADHLLEYGEQGCPILTAASPLPDRSQSF